MNLIDGKCPLCNTPVVTVVNGVSLYFKPHDDPEWCREAALLHVRSMERAIKGLSEDVALVKYRETFYRCSYAAALHRLECETDRDRERWREEIEREVHGDAKRAKERAEIASTMYLRGDFDPRDL